MHVRSRRTGTPRPSAGVQTGLIAPVWFDSGYSSFVSLRWFMGLTLSTWWRTSAPEVDSPAFSRAPSWQLVFDVCVPEEYKISGLLQENVVVFYVSCSTVDSRCCIQCCWSDSGCMHCIRPRAFHQISHFRHEDGLGSTCLLHPAVTCSVSASPEEYKICVFHVALVSSGHLFGALSSSPKAPGTKSHFGKERTHREELSKSVRLVSAVLSRRTSRTDHMRKPCERCARKAAFDLAKNITGSRILDKATFFTPIEAKVMPARTSKRIEEREFLVDSGASMHMMSKKELSSEEMETVTRSRTPHCGVDCRWESAHP